MGIKNQLLLDLKTSMKNKDNVAKNTIQLVRAKILNIEKDRCVELDDNAITDIIVKEVKDRKIAKEDFVKGNRFDLISQTDCEISVLERYLPKQLTKYEVEEIVVGLYNELEDKSIGSLIKAVKAKIGAGSDGKTISEVVKEVIGG